MIAVAGTGAGATTALAVTVNGQHVTLTGIAGTIYKNWVDLVNAMDKSFE